MDARTFAWWGAFTGALIMGCGSGDSDAAPASGAAGSSSGGSSSGGAGGSAAGAAGSPAGGAGGAAGGTSAAGEFFEFDATIGSTPLKGRCTPQTDTLAADALGQLKAGLQFNIGCPGQVVTYNKNGGCYVVVKEIEKLPAGAYSFTLADAKAADKLWEMSCALPNMGAGLHTILANGEAATLSGTWDPATREITGAATGTWKDGGTGQPASSVTLSFKGKVP